MGHLEEALAAAASIDCLVLTSSLSLFSFGYVQEKKMMTRKICEFRKYIGQVRYMSSVNLLLRRTTHLILKYD